MATPAASEIGGVIHVFDRVAYAASAPVIATACLIAVSVPTLRAASIDPIATLRKAESFQGPVHNRQRLKRSTLRENR